MNTSQITRILFLALVALFVFACLFSPVSAESTNAIKLSISNSLRTSLYNDEEIHILFGLALKHSTAPFNRKYEQDPAMLFRPGFITKHVLDESTKSLELELVFKNVNNTFAGWNPQYSDFFTDVASALLYGNDPNEDRTSLDMSTMALKGSNYYISENCEGCVDIFTCGCISIVGSPLEVYRQGVVFFMQFQRNTDLLPRELDVIVKNIIRIYKPVVLSQEVEVFVSKLPILNGKVTLELFMNKRDFYGIDISSDKKKAELQKALKDANDGVLGVKYISQRPPYVRNAKISLDCVNGVTCFKLPDYSKAVLPAMAFTFSAKRQKLYAKELAILSRIIMTHFAVEKKTVTDSVIEINTVSGFNVDVKVAFDDKTFNYDSFTGANIAAFKDSIAMANIFEEDASTPVISHHYLEDECLNCNVCSCISTRGGSASHIALISVAVIVLAHMLFMA